MIHCLADRRMDTLERRSNWHDIPHAYLADVVSFDHYLLQQVMDSTTHSSSVQQMVRDQKFRINIGRNKCDHKLTLDMVSWWVMAMTPPLDRLCVSTPDKRSVCCCCWNWTLCIITAQFYALHIRWLAALEVNSIDKIHCLAHLHCLAHWLVRRIYMQPEVASITCTA